MHDLGCYYLILPQNSIYNRDQIKYKMYRYIHYTVTLYTIHYTLYTIQYSHDHARNYKDQIRLQ